MAASSRKKNKQEIEEVSVSKFKDINIHFPGDVYQLAVWIAMADRAKSIPTRILHTTLHGLANKFINLCETAYADPNPLSSEDVLSIFRSHGIKGNPLLTLDNENET
ncbi:MAG: hypothetical protein ACOC3W_12130 [Thermodesulfobacteriota bacterium]